MPRRLVDRGRPEDGAWGRWARFVLRRPVAVAAVGLAIVAVLAGLGTQLNAERGAARATSPARGTAIDGREQLADAGISPGVMKPLDVLVEHGGDPQQVAATAAHRARRRRGERAATGSDGPNSLVEAFPAIDGSAPGIQAIIDRSNAALAGHRRRR